LFDLYNLVLNYNGYKHLNTTYVTNGITYVTLFSDANI